MGHLLMENRSGLIVDALLTSATGTAEREAAEAMLGRQQGAIAPGSEGRYGVVFGDASTADLWLENHTGGGRTVMRQAYQAHVGP